MGRKASKENNLVVTHSHLIEEWNFEKNGDLKPEDVTYGSKTRAHWKCRRYPDEHQWSARVCSRTTNHIGCPYCSGRYATRETNLASTHPNLVDEWSPENDLKPEDVTRGSEKLIKWRCKKDHEWIASVVSRTKNSGKCPYCAGKRVSFDNNLAVLYPEIAKDWHPTRNRLQPDQVLPKSNRRVWWQCEKEHEWQSPISSRTRYLTGCPKCRPQSSRAEMRIFCELHYIFPCAKWGERIHKIECDIYIPTYKLGIEYDGVRWHKDKEIKDNQKLKELEKLGITVYRLREEGLLLTSERDIHVSKYRLIPFDIITLLSKILLDTRVSREERKRIKQYCLGNRFINNRDYDKMISNLPKPPPEKSIEVLYPELCKEWSTKNDPLLPNMFTPGSHRLIIWQCLKNPEHTWKATIDNRTRRGDGCPYCSGRYATRTNNLAVKFPELVFEWDPQNNQLPSEFTPGSNKIVSWKCKFGHTWKTRIASRSLKKTKCPYCSGRVLKPNILLSRLSLLDL